MKRKRMKVIQVKTNQDIDAKNEARKRKEMQIDFTC